MYIVVKPCRNHIHNTTHVIQVTLMVDGGRELGLSIRGGVEHGLGVYISLVEEGSVAEIYGLKVIQL